MWGPGQSGGRPPVSTHSPNTQLGRAADPRGRREGLASGATATRPKDFSARPPPPDTKYSQRHTQRGSPRTQSSVLGSEAQFAAPGALRTGRLGIIPRVTFLNQALALTLHFHPSVARGTSSFLPKPSYPFLRPCSQ